MTESSRLTTTAEELAQALETLAEALAHARPDAIAASEAALEAGTIAFRAAVAGAAAGGEATEPDVALVVSAALARCRRLGLSLTLLAGPTAPAAEGPTGYTPVGRPRSAADGLSLVTARG